MYIGDYLARRCLYTPDKVAFIDAAEEPPLRLTYARMNARANQLAHWLQEQGVGYGDRVGIIAHNSVVFFDLFFACSKLGAVMVPFNWRLHPREVEALVQQVEPMLILYGHDVPVDTIIYHLESSKEMPPLWPISERSPLKTAPDLTDLLKHQPDTPITYEGLAEDDTACLLFTGGTTGLPKAVRISHGQIVWNMINTHLADTQPTDIYLNVFPLFHTGGLFAYSMPVLLLGGTMIQMKRVDADEILDLIEREGVTFFAAVPTVFQMMVEAESWSSADLSSLRFCLSGGAPMPVPLIETYQDEKAVNFRQGFGMTEFGPSVFSLSSEDAVRKAGSIGKPNFFVDARVIDPDTNQAVPANTIGELVLRGPTAMNGYFGDEQASIEAFDEEGYFHTGDLARIDEEGYFFIVDRLKDMFISGGENVYPAEIEAVLYEHPAISMCGVIGVSDEQWGEVGTAFIVTRGDKSLKEGDVLNFLKERLASYKIPKSIVFMSSLPLTGAGKVQKTELVAIAEQIRSQSTSEESA